MKPDCYNCVHRHSLPGDAHSSCDARHAKVAGNRHGILNGWFLWPISFDPAWLESCDSFQARHVPVSPEVEQQIDASARECITDGGYFGTVETIETIEAIADIIESIVPDSGSDFTGGGDFGGGGADSRF